ncbi:MAG: hypothetical protein HC925_08200, partial [Coleofasciculaceae cyanobacterium SM2_3_26]|nr:hypothetical protein [Coleofasciculaceae cyanobacterium SM2_3_26]
MRTALLVVLSFLLFIVPVRAEGISLDAEEMAAFGDRFFPSYMTQEHIPGALFLVVKDGQV